MSATHTVDTMNAIRSRFAANIESRTFPIEYDNAPGFEKPDNGDWGRLTILPGDKLAIGKGSPGSDRYRLVGVAVLQYFAVGETGTAALWGMFDTVKGLFQGVTADNVTYRTPRPINVGRVGKWYQVNFHCPFYSDDIA